ncbi:hypothetical protein JDM601_3826 [Mycolicibacter sinensis]|uniref:Uncharacterized protein n=1 Tax=Mycolicibacter sinensis (strain JDM601) TaxID=875328 RepID=F5YRN5_MYCSD|nr:hypothetical protein JDM601_3826 [Mycolicibacter sinensis]
MQLAVALGFFEDGDGVFDLRLDHPTPVFLQDVWMLHTVDVHP